MKDSIYQSPEMELLGMLSISILCQSGVDPDATGNDFEWGN